VATLLDLEVELVFGLPGVHNLPIWKALSESSVRVVGARHEQGAAYAADGYARATGKLGVALVTTGPGAANTLAAIGEAMASSSPVLVVATDIPHGLRRDGVYRGVLHETRDQAAMFGPVTKDAYTAQPGEDLGSRVRRAASIALRPNSGPVYLGVPTDLLSAPAVTLPIKASELAPHHAPCDVALLKQACELLAVAELPLIWAGGGALRSGAGALIGRIAETLRAPVVTTYMGRGLLPPAHPYLAPGPVHIPQIGQLWDQADAVLAIGTDFDGMMTQNWLMPQPSKLIAINVDPADANKNYACDITLVGDAAQVLAAMEAQLDTTHGEQYVPERLQALGAEIRAFVEHDEPEAAQMLDRLGRILPDDAIVVADMCIPGYWLAGFGRVSQPRKFAYPVGWGTLGFAFPAAVGTALAGEGPTICVTGDGGFMFACGELATIAQEQVPLVTILVDDGGYGMLRFDQVHAGDSAFGVDLHRPDFVQVARAFGVTSEKVQGFGVAFEQCLTEALRRPVPYVLVVEAALKPPPTTSPRWYRRV
jgi:thiamine pyrophosphate-dependent acetolactate synthase large subunit-like protein